MRSPILGTTVDACRRSIGATRWLPVGAGCVLAFDPALRISLLQPITLRAISATGAPLSVINVWGQCDPPALRRNSTSTLHLDGHPGSHRQRRRNYTSSSDTNPFVIPFVQQQTDIEEPGFIAVRIVSGGVVGRYVLEAYAIEDGRCGTAL